MFNVLFLVGFLNVIIFFVFRFVFWLFVRIFIKIKLFGLNEFGLFLIIELVFMVRKLFLKMLGILFVFFEVIIIIE